MNRYFSIVITIVFAFAGCKKMKTSAVKHADVDACSLITRDEVKAIQGSPVTDTKANVQSDGKFRYSQCFYTTAAFNKSVSLAVTQADSASATPRDPKEFWEQTFGKYEGERRQREGDEEEKGKSLANESEGKGRAPKKIEDIGDDAFWSQGRVGGAIYVLKDHLFLRISIGGPDTEEVRLEKTKQLAAKALSKL